MDVVGASMTAECCGARGGAPAATRDATVISTGADTDGCDARATGAAARSRLGISGWRPASSNAKMSGGNGRFRRSFAECQRLSRTNAATMPRTMTTAVGTCEIPPTIGLGNKRCRNALELRDETHRLVMQEADCAGRTGFDRSWRPRPRQIRSAKTLRLTFLMLAWFTGHRSRSIRHLREAAERRWLRVARVPARVRQRAQRADPRPQRLGRVEDDTHHHRSVRRAR